MKRVISAFQVVLLVLHISGSNAFADGSGEYCYEEKCWQYEKVSNVRVGGMALADGTYIRADHTKREVDGKEKTSQRMATLEFSGDIVDVEIFSFDPGPNPYKISFRFGYDVSTSSVIEEKTEIDELIGVREDSILRSIPEIADDLLKNHGTFSSGESANFLKTISIKGTPVSSDHTLTVLGATRYQGDDYILLRSEYTLELDTVTARAEGYLMQDAETSMPRHSAHLVNMKVGEQETIMKSEGYVSILPR